MNFEDLLQELLHMMRKDIDSGKGKIRYMKGHENLEF